MHLERFHVAMRLMLWLPCLLSVQTLVKLNELIEENEVTGTCANGVHRARPQGQGRVLGGF
jgi:hypothetical protein